MTSLRRVERCHLAYAQVEANWDSGEQSPKARTFCARILGQMEGWGLEMLPGKAPHHGRATVLTCRHLSDLLSVPAPWSPWVGDQQK